MKNTRSHRNGCQFILYRSVVSEEADLIHDDARLRSIWAQQSSGRSAYATLRVYAHVQELVHRFGSFLLSLMTELYHTGERLSLYR